MGVVAVVAVAGVVVVAVAGVAVVAVAGVAVVAVAGVVVVAAAAMVGVGAAAAAVVVGRKKEKNCGFRSFYFFLRKKVKALKFFIWCFFYRRWLGAWWIGFLVIAVGLFLFSPLMTLFPQRLPGEYKNAD